MLKINGRNSMHKEYTATCVVLFGTVLISLFGFAASLFLFKDHYFKAFACILISGVLSFIARNILAPWHYRCKREKENHDWTNGKP